MLLEPELLRNAAPPPCLCQRASCKWLRTPGEGVALPRSPGSCTTGTLPLPYPGRWYLNEAAPSRGMRDPLGLAGLCLAQPGWHLNDGV